MLETHHNMRGWNHEFGNLSANIIRKIVKYQYLSAKTIHFSLTLLTLSPFSHIPPFFLAYSLASLPACLLTSLICSLTSFFSCLLPYLSTHLITCWKIALLTKLRLRLPIHLLADRHTYLLPYLITHSVAPSLTSLLKLLSTCLWLWPYCHYVCNCSVLKMDDFCLEDENIVQI